MTLPEGIESTDVTNTLIADWGRTIPYEAVSTTSNNDSGDGTPTYATAANITAAFYTETKEFDREHEGVTEMTIGVLWAQPSSNVTKGSRITIDGSKWIIREIIREPNNTDPMIDICECWKEGSS